MWVGKMTSYQDGQKQCGNQSKWWVRNNHKREGFGYFVEASGSVQKQLNCNELKQSVFDMELHEKSGRIFRQCRGNTYLDGRHKCRKHESLFCSECHCQCLGKGRQ